MAGKAVEIALNRGHLLKALRFGLNQIQIQDSLTPLILSAPGKTMVVMPVRMECQPEAPQPISPTENAPDAPPSAPAVNNATEERKQTMSTATTMRAPERGSLSAHNNGTNGHEDTAETRSAFKAALERIDRIKTNLRDVLSELNDAMSMLKTAEKEQRATAKEIEAVRSKLREIQSVEI